MELGGDTPDTTLGPGSVSHRGEEGTRPHPGPPQEKKQNLKKNVQIEKTTSVDRIPPLGFLQL